MKEAKAEADDYQRGLADRARSKFLASKQGGGLVIHRALYGVLPLGAGNGWRGSDFETAPIGMAGANDFEDSDGSSLLDAPEPELQSENGAAERDGDRGGADADDAGARERVAFYDVTTALQLRVEEKARRGVGSKLRIETDTDFAEQQGFADPCMGVKKQLRIAYSWRGQQFLAVSQTVLCGMGGSGGGGVCVRARGEGGGAGGGSRTLLHCLFCVAHHRLSVPTSLMTNSDMFAPTRYNGAHRR